MLRQRAPGHLIRHTFTPSEFASKRLPLRQSFDPADRLYLQTAKAYDSLHELHMGLHYVGCGMQAGNRTAGGMGYIVADGNPGRRGSFEDWAAETIPSNNEFGRGGREYGFAYDGVFG